MKKKQQEGAIQVYWTCSVHIRWNQRSVSLIFRKTLFKMTFHIYINIHENACCHPEINRKNANPLALYAMAVLMILRYFVGQFVFCLSIALSKSSQIESNRIIHSFEEIAHLANDTIITYLSIKMQFLSFSHMITMLLLVGFNPYRFEVFDAIVVLISWRWKKQTSRLNANRCAWVYTYVENWREFILNRCRHNERMDHPNY